MGKKQQLQIKAVQWKATRSRRLPVSGRLADSGRLQFEQFARAESLHSRTRHYRESNPARPVDRQDRRSTAVPPGLHVT